MRQAYLPRDDQVEGTDRRGDDDGANDPLEGVEYAPAGLKASGDINHQAWHN